MGERWDGDEKPRLIATANAEMIMQAQEDKELGRILNRADLVVPDGAGVLWAGETLGTPFPERVTGADLSVELLKIASKEGWPVYFLGGAPGVAKKAADRFQKSHGEIRLVGCHDGYFDEEEEKRIIKDIRKSGAKLLLVGLGVPKQEKWLYRHKDELGPVLAMGIGGVFDVMSGNLKRAPLDAEESPRVGVSSLPAALPHRAHDGHPPIHDGCQKVEKGAGGRG